MEAEMRIVFLVAVFFAAFQTVFAAVQTVAVLYSEGEGVLNDDQLKFLTEKAREMAVKVLPQSSFEVFPQDVVIKRLGGFDSYRKACKENTCIVELGKKANVDYIAQCRFGKLSPNLTITFELYKVSTGGLVDNFTEDAKNFNGLRAIVEKRIPESFKKIPGASPVGGETSGAKNDAEAYYKRGNTYAEKGDYDKAIFDFTEAIRLKPNYAEAYDLRGRAYVFKGDYDIAISDFNEAIRLKPKYTSAYLGRGMAYQDKKDYDRAISDYTQAIRLDPKYTSAYFWRGMAYFLKGDYDKAISDFNEAIRLNPKYADAYFSRAGAYYNKNDYDRAISDYTQAIQLDPKYTFAYLGRGVAYQDKKDYDRAISDFNEAIRLDPKYTSAYFRRGMAYQDKKDYDRAISDFNEAIRLNPKYVDAYFYRGMTYYVEGDYSRAIADYESALRIDPNDSYAREALSYARNALENLNKQPIYKQPAYKQPTYKQQTYKQPTYKQSSSESIDFNEFVENVEIGWQQIWDMYHLRWSYSSFYNTMGYKSNSEFSEEFEWIIGVIYRWGIMKPITIGFGLFGGLGARHSFCDEYYDEDKDDCDTEMNTNMRHELGVELILGVVSLYIAERNFGRIGYGIGFIF
jgi:tetratricopeptide (TPR) repeat protein